MIAKPLLRRIAALALPLVWASGAQAQDYYAGKRLTVLVNYSAGGPADIDARVFARNIGRHIAGNPTVIVQNMDGAGGQVGANYMVEVAPKDGTMMGLLTGSAFVAAAVPKQGRGDFKALEFVAAQPSTSVYYMRTDVKPGIKDATDLAKAEGVIVGGLAVDSSKDILLRLTLDVMGVPFKYVTSYRGTNAVRLALQQGEVNITSESPPAYRGVVEPSLVQKGIAIPVYYDPGWDGTKFTTPKDVADLPILPYHQLYEKAKGKPASGPLFEAYKSALFVTGNLYRLFAFPTGTPKEAQEALRVAISKLASDKEYAEDATKAFGYVPAFETSADLAPRIRKALSTTPEQQAFFADYIAKASTLGNAGSEAKK